jgi:hypothetical protein
MRAPLRRAAYVQDLPAPPPTPVKRRGGPSQGMLGGYAPRSERMAAMVYSGGRWGGVAADASSGAGQSGGGIQF